MYCYCPYVRLASGHDNNLARQQKLSSRRRLSRPARSDHAQHGSGGVTVYVPRNQPSTLSTMPSKRDASAADTAADRPTAPSKPSGLPTFLTKLKEYIQSGDANYMQLIQRRCVMYRNTTCVTSATHARLLMNAIYPEGTFADPAPTSTAFRASLVPTIKAPPPLSPAPLSSGKRSSSPPPDASKTAPSPSTMYPVTDYSNKLTPAEEDDR